MSQPLQRYGAKEIFEVVIWVNCGNGYRRPYIFLEDLKELTLEFAADTVPAEGGIGNKKLLKWADNPTLNITMTSALISPAQLALMAGTGTATSPGPTGFPVAEIETIQADSTDGSLTLKYTPMANTIYVLPRTGGVTHVQQLYGVTIAGMKVSGPSLPIPAPGQEVFYTVVYTRAITDPEALRVGISSQMKTISYQITGSGWFRRYPSEVDEGIKFRVYRAQIDNNWTLAFSASGDPATFDLAFEALQDPNFEDLAEIIFTNEFTSALGADFECTPSDMPAPIPVNKTLLQAEITADQADYDALFATGGPYTPPETAFMTSFTAAEALMLNASATQVQVDAALADLTAKHAAL